MQSKAGHRLTVFHNSQYFANDFTKHGEKQKTLYRLPTHLSWKDVKRPQNMKKRKVCRVCLVHFTEHIFCISYFTSFRLGWRFFNETSKVSCRKSKFHENGEKCVQDCLGWLHTYHETPWNDLEIWKSEKCVQYVWCIS